ncbi:MAG: transposase zinc-binding domain-containing protein [Gammaproteobacteria bacterium]
MDTPPLVAEAARGKVELADIVRVHGAAFCATHRLSGVQRRALRAIEACRTATLGGHVQQCDACGAVRYTYHPKNGSQHVMWQQFVRSARQEARLLRA